MTIGEHNGLPAPTPIWEQRLIRAAKRGDRAAETRLLELYEPMVRHLTRTMHLAGGDREDLAQEARLGVLGAIRAWDPERRVPFKSFAWLCAIREARMAVNASRAGKHQPLNAARTLHRADDDGHALEETLEATGRPDEDPVAKLLGRERLQGILERATRLTELERRALALSATDHSHRQCARKLGVGERAVNNALQRARRKLVGAAIG